MTGGGIAGPSQTFFIQQQSPGLETGGKTWRGSAGSQQGDRAEQWRGEGRLSSSLSERSPLQEGQITKKSTTTTVLLKHNHRKVATMMPWQTLKQQPRKVLDLPRRCWWRWIPTPLCAMQCWGMFSQPWPPVMIQNNSWQIIWKIKVAERQNTTCV